MLKLLIILFHFDTCWCRAHAYELPSQNDFSLMFLQNIKLCPRWKAYLKFSQQSMHMPHMHIPIVIIVNFCVCCHGISGVPASPSRKSYDYVGTPSQENRCVIRFKNRENIKI